MHTLRLWRAKFPFRKSINIFQNLPYFTNIQVPKYWRQRNMSKTSHYIHTLFTHFCNLVSNLQEIWLHRWHEVNPHLFTFSELPQTIRFLRAFLAQKFKPEVTHIKEDIGTHTRQAKVEKAMTKETRYYVLLYFDSMPSRTKISR